MNSSPDAPWKEGRECSDRWKETLGKGFLPRVSDRTRRAFLSANLGEEERLKIRATLLRYSVLAILGLVLVSGFGRLFSQPKVQRYGMVIGIKPEKIEAYKALHAAAWPGVLKKIKECNIRNYSIYLREIEKGKFYLFSYFEYSGNDFQADMAKMAADPTTQKWWKETNPCQLPIPTRGPKEFWSAMEEVFHSD